MSFKCYSEKYNIVFIHIPKTGGTSINTILEIKNRGHIPASELKRKLPKNKWKNAIKIAVFRNPYDRIYSLYCMRNKKNKSDFLNWLNKKWCNGDRFVWKNQLEMITIGSKIITDKLILYDNLQEEWKEFAINNNLPTDLPLLNSTKKNIDCKKYFNENWIEKIEKKFKRDLDFYKKLVKERGYNEK